MAGASVFYPPSAFGQSHLAGADRVAERVATWIGADARISEFYAGVGPLTLGRAAAGCAVAFNEVGPASLEGLEKGVAALPEPSRRRCRIAPGPASEWLSLLDDADTVVVDPPRRGLDTDLCRALARRAPEQLIYASCGLDSFQRDLEILLDSGRLALRDLELHDLFPYTEHVETLARLKAA